MPEAANKGPGQPRGWGSIRRPSGRPKRRQSLGPNNAEPLFKSERLGEKVRLLGKQRQVGIFVRKDGLFRPDRPGNP